MLELALADLFARVSAGELRTRHRRHLSARRRPRRRRSPWRAAATTGKLLLDPSADGPERSRTLSWSR